MSQVDSISTDADSAIGKMRNEYVHSGQAAFAKWHRYSVTSPSLHMYEHIASHSRMYHKYKEGGELSILVKRISLTYCLSIFAS
jgi:hypothetical protein